MTTKVEYGKSKKWYNEHCGLCKKTFTKTEDRYNGHCTFNNDEKLDFFACEKCAKEANMDTAIKQTKELSKHDTHDKDLQPENKKVSSDKPADNTGKKPKKTG